MKRKLLFHERPTVLVFHIVFHNSCNLNHRYFEDIECLLLWVFLVIILPVASDITSIVNTLSRAISLSLIKFT